MRYGVIKRIENKIKTKYMMKKLLVVCGLICTLTANAQDAYDVSRIMGSELNGTARFVGMGGAMGALGGDISVMTGVDADGKVTGVNILSHAETAGLGAKAAEQSFRDRFVGLVSGITVSKDKAGENSIDAITGATITSRAMTEAVNAAIEAAGGANNG